MKKVKLARKSKAEDKTIWPIKIAGEHYIASINIKEQEDGTEYVEIAVDFDRMRTGGIKDFKKFQDDIKSHFDAIERSISIDLQ